MGGDINFICCGSLLLLIVTTSFSALHYGHKVLLLIVTSLSISHNGHNLVIYIYHSGMTSSFRIDLHLVHIWPLPKHYFK